MKRISFFLLLALCFSGLSAQPVVKEHSANKALALSLLPGAGQVYNKQAWKIPIIYGALGTMGYFVYDNYQSMSVFKDEYLFRVNNNGQTLSPELAQYPTQNIYNMYESYNKNFQLMIIISVAVYGINLIDAYVFGHLFDYQIDDDIAMTLSPSLLPTSNGTCTPALGVGLRF